MTGNQEKSQTSISENQAGNIGKKRQKGSIDSAPSHLRLSPQSSVLSSFQFSQSSVLSPQSSGLKLRNFARICIDLLRRGNRVRFRAPGYSMYPTILHEDVITVEPVKVESIKVGDIVLYQSENSVIAHRVVKIKNKSDIHTDSQSSALSPALSSAETQGPPAMIRSTLNKFWARSFPSKETAAASIHTASNSNSSVMLADCFPA
jgi:hypothetical protein